MSQQPTALIIGAGPAGLAVAAELTRHHIPHTLLEAADTVGHSWRTHYDRLHLHTPRWHSGLPGLPMPADYPRYPSRQQVVDYLDSYARHFGIRPRFGQRVRLARRVGHHWEVLTQDGDYRAPVLIVATGVNDVPNIPHWPGEESYGGRILHSKGYRSGRDFIGKRVLVVGFGNSGGEIALDLFEQGAASTLSVRGPVNVIPKEVLGISYLDIGLLQQKLPAKLADRINAGGGRRLIGDLRPYGLTKPEIGMVEQVRTLGKVGVIDIGTVGRIKAGDIGVRPGIERFTPSGVVFTDGRQEEFDAVVLATGFRPGVANWLRVPDETLRHLRELSGKPTPEPGLYFVGQYVSPVGMLRQSGIEARQVAKLVARLAGEGAL